ncbi:extracellular metalloprotease precursor [Alternaria burnsii]|uniref:Extracellular metalloprotease n=1 Tax=Alternaria burnsii TaxID=1187904 RepID=A0A8H7AZI9_9PLEO|nr:extracellular metalloprotease precursor [Alternaria burnsii]KAF7673591.1 extracellular metalloprotease precursor [Alternaria burnsii]
MEKVQQYPVCGFVPPYILSAIAKSADTKPDPVGKDTGAACKDTLEHQEKSYITQRHKLCTGTQQTLVAAGATLPGSVQREIYDCKRTGNLPGDPARSEGGARTEDRQVTNVYDGFGITYNFFSEIFKRNSLDGKGLPLIGSVHYRPGSTPKGYNNAYWDGEEQRMVFGDGDHITFDYLTDSLDVIAHELSHGFVQFSSPLKYEWQSGALNESCADIFGSMVEQWYMKQSVDDADWILGQTLFPVAFTGSALRTFKAGKAYTKDPIFGTDPQPKHMDHINKEPGDNRGVHINSGIPNHAFYLAAKSLGGYSWETAGKVWYETMTSGKIKPNCDFKTFAKVTVDVAGETFVDKSVQKAIFDAWVKVGVLAQTKL